MANGGGMAVLAMIHFRLEARYNQEFRVWFDQVDVMAEIGNIFSL